MKISALICAAGYSESLQMTIDCLNTSYLRPTNILVGDCATEPHQPQLYGTGIHHYPSPRDGFAANANRLLRTAHQHGSDYAFLIGADVFVLPDTLRKLVSASVIGHDIIIQPQLLDTTVVYRKRPRSGLTTCMAGNCTLIPLRWQREQNIWFDESFWSYGEDTQFGMDWLKTGGQIYQTSNIYAVHHHEGYFNSNPKLTRKYYYLMRNSLHLAKRYPQWRVQGIKIALGLLALKFSSNTLEGLIAFLVGEAGPHPKDKL